MVWIFVDHSVADGLGMSAGLISLSICVKTQLWGSDSVILTLRGSFSAVSEPISQVNIRLEALDNLYQFYILLHLWNPIGKPRKATFSK